MAERRTISRVSDMDQGAGQSGQEQRQLTLTGIVNQNDRQTMSRVSDRQQGGTDNYVDFGPTGVDQRAEAQRTAGGDGKNCPKYEGGTKVCVREGETLWGKAEQQYGGKHPLEAIYAANGMYPKVTNKDGRIELTDPVYKPGEYTLPDPKDIPALTKQYRQHVEQEGRSSQQRTGPADQQTDVKLIYGDTFERLSRTKYGKDVPVEAIYEANGLKPRVVDGCEKEPIYYAGKTYHMPAEKDIPDLVRKYYDDRGCPEKCPPQYRKGGATTDGGNYGDDGETPRDHGRTTTGGDAQGEKRDTKYYNEGYEDGYKDGLKRGQKCGCGGGGCEACRGKGHQREQQEQQPVRRTEVQPQPAPAPVVREQTVYSRPPQQVVYDDRQRQGINPVDIIAPLAIAGMIFGGLRGHRGWNDHDYGRERWQAEQNRRMWQSGIYNNNGYDYSYGSNYDSEYGYGRRVERYIPYQPQIYNPGHYHRRHSGW